MGTNWPWNWRLTVLLQLTVKHAIKMTMVRPPMTNFKITIRVDCAVSACSPMQLPPSVYKSSCLLIVGDGGLGGVSHWAGSHPQHTPPPLHQSCLFISFGQRAARPHFWLQGDSDSIFLPSGTRAQWGGKKFRAGMQEEKGDRDGESQGQLGGLILLVPAA